MAKRFTDTNLWGKKWFRTLQPSYKAAWMFIKDRCDEVGVWDVDEEAIEFMVGASIDLNELKGSCNGNVVVLDNGKWWLPDFCDFQYGELTETCKPHKKYIALLKKHGLYERVLKGYTKGINTLQEQEQEQEKEKEEEKEEIKKPDLDAIYDFETAWKQYPRLVNAHGKKLHAGSKPQSRQQFKKHINTEQKRRDFKLAVAAYAVDKPDGKYVKHMERWIRDALWLNYAKSAVPTPAKVQALRFEGDHFADCNRPGCTGKIYRAMRGSVADGDRCSVCHKLYKP